MFLWLFISSVFADPQLPTIQAVQLQPGSQWTWNYYEKGDHSKFYSSERYTVARVDDDLFTFEIWTMYAGETEYTRSAKFVVNLSDCRHAFDGGTYHPFTLNLYGVAADGSWLPDPAVVPSTAFEEKFNCNPNLYMSGDKNYETIFDHMLTPWGDTTVFQQLPKNNSSQIRSFYFFDKAALAGVAFTKRFNANSPYEYSFELATHRDYPQR